MEEADLKEDREIIGLVCREDRKGDHELRLNLINLGERKTLVMRILPITSRHSDGTDQRKQGLHWLELRKSLEYRPGSREIMMLGSLFHSSDLFFYVGLDRRQWKYGSSGFYPATSANSGSGVLVSLKTPCAPPLAQLILHSPG